VPTCSACGVCLRPDGVYLDPDGQPICRECQARRIVGVGDQHIKTWKVSHSPGMYAGAGIVTAILLALGLVRYC